MKNLFKIIFAGFLLVVMNIACNKDNDVVIPVDDSSAVDTCTVIFSFFEEYSDVDTKSVYFSDESIIDQCKSYSIYLYNSLGQAVWSGKTNKVTNLSIQDYTAVVLVNLPEYPEQSALLEDFLATAKYPVNTVNPSINGVPMSAVRKISADEISSGNVSIQLDRQICRVSFRLDKSLLPSGTDIIVKAVNIEQVPAYITPFAEAGFVAETREDISSMGDMASASDLAKVNNGEFITLYTYENAQGQLLPGNTDPLKRSPENIGSKLSLCSFLVINAEFTGDYEGATVSTNELTYKYYLGKDNSDFSVLSNHTHTYVLQVTNDGVFQDTWKVSYGKELPVVSYILEPTQPEYAVDLGSVVKIDVNYKKYVDDFEVINKIVTNESQWSIVDNTVAGLQSPGVIKGFKKGTTTVHAAYMDDLSCDIPLTVNDVTSYKYRFELRGDSNVKVGSNTSKYKVYYAKDIYTNGVLTERGDFQEWTDVVEWSLSSNSLATISDGVVTALKSGHTSVNASLTYTNGGISKKENLYLTLTIEDLILYKYRFEISGATAATVGETISTPYRLYYARDKYVNGELKTSGSLIQWTGDISWSVNPSYATISVKKENEYSCAYLTTRAAGETSIKAIVTYESQEYLAELTILISSQVTYDYRLKISGPSSLDYGEEGKYELLVAKDIYIDGVLESKGTFSSTDNDVYWNSSNPLCATFTSSNGTLNARRGGVVTITARMRMTVDGTSQTYESNMDVTINDVYSYETRYMISGSSEIIAGQSAQYKVRSYVCTIKNGIFESSSDFVDYTGNVEWSIDSENYATLLLGGRLKGLAPGTVKLYATFVDESSTTKTIGTTVTITEAITYQYRFFISGDSTVGVGQSTNAYKITYARDTYTNGVLTSEGTIRDWDMSARVTWSVDNTDIATISNGIVTGIKGGTVIVRADIHHDLGTSTVSCTLLVRDVITYDYRFEIKGSNTVYVGKTSQYTLYYARDTYTNGVLTSSGNMEEWPSSNVTWSVIGGLSNASIAGERVGTVTGIKSGTAKISATVNFGGKDYSVDKSITINDDITTAYVLQIGGGDKVYVGSTNSSFSLSCTKKTYTNGTFTSSVGIPIGSVTWSISSGSSYASISSSGGSTAAVTGLSPGIAQIKAVATIDGLTYSATKTITVEAANSSITPGTGWEEGGEEEYN